MFLSTCIIITLHAKVATKVMNPTLTPARYSSSPGYDCHILTFVDVKVKEGIPHVSAKEEEEGMKDDRGNYRASMHSSTLVTLNVLVPLWTLIHVSNSLL